MKPSFLLDANISPQTADYLVALGYDAASLLTAGLGQLDDDAIVEIAKQEDRIIVTHDLDFGQIYYFAEGGQVGIIVLRLRIQTVEMVNRVLGTFLQSRAIEIRKLEKTLIVLTETTARVFQLPVETSTE